MHADGAGIGIAAVQDHRGGRGCVVDQAGLRRAVRAVQAGCHAGDRAAGGGRPWGRLRACGRGGRAAAGGVGQRAFGRFSVRNGRNAYGWLFGDVRGRGGTRGGDGALCGGSGREDRMRRRTPRQALSPHRRRRPLPQPLLLMGPHRGWGLLEAPRLRRRTRSTLRRRAFCCRW